MGQAEHEGLQWPSFHSASTNGCQSGRQGGERGEEAVCCLPKCPQGLATCPEVAESAVEAELGEQWPGGQPRCPQLASVGGALQWLA